MKKIVLWIIKIYQKTLSPDHGLLSYRYREGYCRFYPSCSQYAREAIDRYGITRGGIKTIKRVFRCNPFSQGGYDPLEPNK